jgi:hypothetical protein
MAEYGPCEICGNTAEYNTLPPNWPLRRTCPRCGEFEYEELSRPPWPKPSPDGSARLSGWVREQNAAGVIPVRITRERAAHVMQMRLPGLGDRANHALSVVARDHCDDWFVPNTLVHDLELQGVSYSRSQNELFLLFKILEEQGFLKWGTGAMAALTVKGLLAAEALGASKSSAARGFVAMRFDKGMHDAWTNGFDPGIRTAGFQPVRIDKEDYIGGISDEIMAEIRRSRLVVADYTGQNNGVYFEAGFALGLGLKVIPTCRADEITNLHFDIRHINTLLWNTPAELADGLNKRIRAVIGAGPAAPDP